MGHAGLALIVSGFPRRSETFALHELLALEERGVLTAIFATKPGDGLPPQPGCERLLERVAYLPPGDAACQAEVLMERLQGKRVAGIHAYFAHTPAEVAEHGANRLQLPFGFSVHARDARKVSAGELLRRGRAARCVVACNDDVAQHFEGGAVPLHILPHGVDTARFKPHATDRSLAPLSSLPAPLRLLAVGRLVEKKGFDLLIQAVKQLPFPFQLHIQLQIVGDGPQRDYLKSLIEEAKLSQQVHLRASVTHEELPALYASADIVVVPSVVDRNGDRDGLPNVLLEAMACGRPVIAGDAGAVGSAIRSGYNGLLTPAGDVTALAAAIEKLGSDPTYASALGQTARRHVEKYFELAGCTSRFCDFLEHAYGLQGC